MPSVLWVKQYIASEVALCPRSSEAEMFLQQYFLGLNQHSARGIGALRPQARETCLPGTDPFLAI